MTFNKPPPSVSLDVSSQHLAEAVDFKDLPVLVSPVRKSSSLTFYSSEKSKLRLAFIRQTHLDTHSRHTLIKCLPGVVHSKWGTGGAAPSHYFYDY